MFNRNRIALLATLGVILIVGFLLVANNLRPVSERKKEGRERLDWKIEVRKINKRIIALTDSIRQFPADSYLYYKRAKLYKSINKYEKAIEDYTICLNKTNDSALKANVLKELNSAKNIKAYLDKQNN